VEVYFMGKWRDGGSAFFKLGSNGKGVVRLTGPHEKNLRMRVRAAYVKGSSGDSLNATTRSPWKYSIFTE
jgi:hypothetical protein